MASFSTPGVFSATPLRLPPPAFAAAGSGFPADPILAVAALPPAREDGRARPWRQNPAGQEGRRAGRRDVEPRQGAPRYGDAAPPFDTAGAGSIHFLVQTLNQDLGPAVNPIVRHRDGPVLASDAYRRAGGDPAIYSEQPQLLRIAV
jgi:hypothetical protein